MKTIKVREIEKNIKTSDKKTSIDYLEKKANISTKEKQSSKNDEIETVSTFPDHQAVNQVIKREKKTVAESVYYARKYVKNKHKKKKQTDIRNMRTKEAFQTTTTNSTSNTHSHPSIKQKGLSNKERTMTSRFNSLNGYKSNYNHKMKYLGIQKKQKKIKDATQKTSSTFQKGASATVKSTKIAFKAITKTITSIHNLISFGSALILLVVITLFIGIFATLSSDSGVETSTLPLSSEVIEHTEKIRRYAQENGIEDYVALLQAIMMQESGGKGNDPMQSSECEYNTRYPQKPNGIKEPEYSIQVGVKYFSDCIKESKPKDSYDMQKIYLALQGYNYEKAYISWATTNFNGYTRANAKVYSDEMKAKFQVDTYGDPNYVNHVLQYYHLGNGDIVKVAQSQIGNINGKPYWEWYGFTSRVEWCACFVSWCANEAGLIEKGIIPKFAYCPSGILWFKEHNQWLDRGQIPQAGYIIFFDWEHDGVSDHVGIVEKIENDIIYTIEGNSNNQCKQNMYEIGSNVIYGYGLNK